MKIRFCVVECSNVALRLCSGLIKRRAIVPIVNFVQKCAFLYVGAICCRLRLDIARDLSLERHFPNGFRTGGIVEINRDSSFQQQRLPAQAWLVAQRLGAALGADRNRERESDCAEAKDRQPAEQEFQMLHSDLPVLFGRNLASAR